MQLSYSITALFQFAGAGNAILPKEGPKAEAPQKTAPIGEGAVKEQPAVIRSIAEALENPKAEAPREEARLSEIAAKGEPAAVKNVAEAAEIAKAEAPLEYNAFRKIVVQEQRSAMSHLEQLTKRLGEMSNMLMRLLHSSPALQSAAGVMLERASESTSEFAYSFSKNENGVVTQSFSFSIQFKPQGESSYFRADAAPASAPEGAPVKSGTAIATPTTEPVSVIAGPEIEPVSTSPVSEPEAAPVVEEGAAEKIAAPQSFDEKVAQLVSYYSVSIAVTAAGEEAAVEGEKEESEVAARAGETESAEEARTPEETERRENNLINIDAGSVRRVRTGDGDDNLFINADRARRIYTGGGDDNILINADKVSRVNSGAGDDFIDVSADKVSRVYSGGGDDVVNLDADRVRRVATGGGDDNLIVNADKIMGVHAGSGDDFLTLSADRIGYVNGGAGNDTISLDAEDAAIYFGQGGGDDVIDIKSVGVLAVHVDDRLALSGDDISISRDGVTVTLEFKSGERLTLDNVENADLVSLRVGGETINLHLSEPTIELDMSA